MKNSKANEIHSSQVERKVLISILKIVHDTIFLKVI